MTRALFAHDLFRKPVPTFRVHALAANRHLILLVADVFQPGDVLAVERLLGGDMDHAGRRRRTVPVLFVRRNPDDVARLDLADFAAPALYPARAGDDEQGLAERMRVPGGARTRLEAHQA